MKGNVYEKINYFENWSKQNCLKKKESVKFYRLLSNFIFFTLEISLR